MALPNQKMSVSRELGKQVPFSMAIEKVELISPALAYGNSKNEKRQIIRRRRQAENSENGKK